MLAALAACRPAVAQINPNQVNWPTGSTGCVYAPATNTCVIPSGTGTAVNQNGGSTIATLPFSGFMPQVCADSSGSGTAQSCTTANSFTPQAANCVVYDTTTANSGTGLTVNVNSLGAKSVAVASAAGWTTTLIAGQIPANEPIHLCYDGTRWDASATGFAASSLPTGEASGDLCGSYPNPTVCGLGAVPFIETPAWAMGDVPCYDGVQLTPCPPSGGAAQILYLTNTASDISGYDLWDTSPLGSQFTVTNTIPTTTTKTLIKAFATASIYPAATVIPAGEWQADTYVQVSNANGTTTLNSDVYDRTAGGMETLLFSFSSPTISGNGTGIQAISLEIIEPAFSIGATDRLVIKYSMTKTGGSSITGTVYGGGALNYSHVHTPLGSSAAGITQLTGDVTAGPGSGSQASVLATVNSGPGSCGDATHVCQITTNGKGLTTAQTPVAITGGSGLAGVNAKTTSYTAVSGDNNKAIPLNCASACTLTLPTSVPAAPWAIFVSCEGLAACSVVPTSGASLLAANGANLGTGSLNPGMGVSIWSDGTNYHVNQGGVITGSTVIPVLVQSIQNGCGAGPCTISYTSNVSPGDALIFECQHGVAGDCDVTPSDVQEDTFVLKNSVLVSGNFELRQFVACNAAGGPTTITSTSGGTIMAAYEVTNVATSSCVDAYTAQGTTNNVYSLGTGSITTTVANDFIFVSGATRSGASVFTLSEANGYANPVQSGLVANALHYAGFTGLDPSTGSLSDTVSQNLGTGVPMYAGILALKPSTNSTTIINGDLIEAGVLGGFQALHAGTLGYVLTSNGPGIGPTYQAPNNPNSGMTATQVAIAGGPGTITSSKPLAGTGAAVTTGPSSSTDQDCVKFTGTVGQIADAGSACGSGGGAGALTQISQTVVSGSSTTSITFSSISASYTNLRLTVMGQSANSTSDWVQIQFNGDTGSHYNYTGVSATNATGGSESFTTEGATSAFIGNISLSSGGNHAAVLECVIYSYSGSAWDKEATCESQLHNSTYENIGVTGLEWTATPAAVTSITLTLHSGADFVAGTRVTLYGMQ
jgi:hypothetical protein